MVRSYLRHEPTMAFGLVASNAARPVLDQDCKTAYVAALEDVLVWDVKTGNQISLWHEISHRSPVTSLTRASAPNSNLFAVGYQDGSLRIWDSISSTSLLTLNGHSRSVTSLTFDPQATRLASGSLDNEIILWDLVAEKGLFRLRGHRDTITDLSFISPISTRNQDATSSSTSTSTNPGHLLSTSKDGLMKLWDLSLQHCLETVVGGKGEISSVAILENLTFTKKSNLPKAEGAGKGKSKQDDLSEDQDDEEELMNGTLILTGSSEGEVRIWELDMDSLSEGITNIANEDGSESLKKFITSKGVLGLSSTHRITQLAFYDFQPDTNLKGKQKSNEDGEKFLGVQSSDKGVEIFRLRNQEEIKKKLIRRRKRQREKMEKKGSKKDGKEEEENLMEDEDQVKWSDRLEAFTIVRPSTTGYKIRSFAFNSKQSNDDDFSPIKTPSILFQLTNNSIEIHSLPLIPKNKAEKSSLEANLSCSLTLPGHRSDIRAVALSSDDKLLASACSSGQLKVWNVKTGKCVRTLSCGYALCLTWLPGDRNIIVGCKDGTLRSFDIPSSKELEVLNAHTGPIWSLSVRPDGMGCVSASADKDVKFWEFEMVEEDFQDEELKAETRRDQDQDEDEDDDEGGEQLNAPPQPERQKRQQLALVHTRTLKMTDDVLYCKYSPDGKLLALALLDSTVKIFFSDSLKFFLSLYGHKLPVLSLDISSDSKLIITVSADKNVKIWGLDFGDCHRSLFAHSESIMSCGFEKGQQGGGLLGGREGLSHHFWTASKDGLLKHWDGDRFELIQTLEGHHGEIWALTAGNNGTLCITSGADKSIRVWEKTDEPLFLEEEREKEMEKNFQNAENNGRDQETRAVGSLASGNIKNGDQEENNGPESLEVTKSTTETLMSGEKLLEAVDLGDMDLKSQALPEGQRPSRSPILMAAFKEDEEPLAEKYVLKVVEKIPNAQLDDALLVLPFDRIVSLIKYLDVWTRKDWNIALVGRILFFILRVHHSQIVANRIMRQSLNSLRKHLKVALNRQKTILGFNLAALEFIKSQYVADKTAEMYEREGLDMDEDAIRAKIQENAKRKRKMVLT